MIIQILLVFTAAVCFSILFNAPKSELIFAGLAAVAAWLTFLLLREFFNSPVVPSLFGSLVAAIISRIFATKRKKPITIFLVGGIIPLVPGAGIYNTMYNLITGERMQAASYGIDTALVAGAIAIGIVVALSLPLP